MRTDSCAQDWKHTPSPAPTFARAVHTQPLAARCATDVGVRSSWMRKIRVNRPPRASGDAEGGSGDWWGWRYGAGRGACAWPRGRGGIIRHDE